MAAFIKPTSLNGGEGLAAGSTGEVGCSESEGEGEEVVERSPKSTREIYGDACRCLFLGSMYSNITNMITNRSRTSHEQHILASFRLIFLLVSPNIWNEFV